MTAKRERCSNFAYNDIELLVMLVDERKCILECKKTDSVSNKLKDREWEKLAVSFNSKSQEIRTTKMIRSKWESLKKIIRKEVAAAQQMRRRTGGGAAEKIKANPWAEKILAIMGAGAVGTTNRFDSDSETYNGNVELENLHSEEPNSSQNNTIIIEDTPVVIEEIHTIDKPENNTSGIEDDWSMWNPTMLRQAVSEPLVIEVPRDSSTSFVTPDTEKSIVSRRRPLLKKRCNSSPAAETNKKFSALADSKLELVQLQLQLAKKESDTRMRMEAEKHALEIQILETELKIKQKILASYKN